VKEAKILGVVDAATGEATNFDRSRRRTSYSRPAYVHVNTNTIYGTWRLAEPAPGRGPIV
jgi:hypothetical protein